MMMKTFLLIFCVSSFLAGEICAQTKKIDKLKKELAVFEKGQNFERDTNYLNKLNKLAVAGYKTNPDSALIWAEKSILLCQKAGFRTGEADAFKNKGLAFRKQRKYSQAIRAYDRALELSEKTGDRDQTGDLYNSVGIVYKKLQNYTKALESHLNALKIREEIGDKKGIAGSLNNIATIYNHQGKYVLALESHFKALTIKEEIGDKKGIAVSLNNIAVIYKNQGKYEKALENHLKALKIKREIGDKKGIAANLNNIAIIYNNLGQYEKSLESHFKSLKIKQEIGDKKGISVSLNNIAEMYTAKEKYTEALEIQLKALKIKQEIGDKKGSIYSLKGLTDIYLALKKYRQAAKYGEEGLLLSNEIGFKDQIRDFNESLSKIYEASGKTKQAFSHYKQFVFYKDSLNSDESFRQSAQLQAGYEYEKKAAVAEVEQAKKDAEEAERRDRLYGIVALAVLALLSLSIVLFFIFRSRKKIRTAYGELEISKALIEEAKEEIGQQAEELQQTNEMLEGTNQVLGRQKKIIEKHHKGLMDSINVAKRIQHGILPSPADLSLLLPEYFILFKPRDVVSGDFYWVAEVNKGEKKHTVLTVADCTGHGVPGAFLSMVGCNIMNNLVKANEITNAGQILGQLDKEVRKTLQQEKEGMDMAVITLISSAPKKVEKFQFAGAMNPLYFVKNGEWAKIKGTKRAIGGQLFRETERAYENHELKIDGPLSIYLCTDGYQDQFGGEKNKKFMVKKLRELLFSISHLPMPEQGRILDETFQNWKGESDQVDDVSILGLRID